MSVAASDMTMPPPPPDKWCGVYTMLATAAFMRYSGYVMDWLEGMVLLAAQKLDLIPTPTTPPSTAPPSTPPPVQQHRGSGLQLEIRMDREKILKEGKESRGKGKESGGKGRNPGGKERNPAGKGKNPEGKGRNPGGKGRHSGGKERNPAGKGTNAATGGRNMERD